MQRVGGDGRAEAVWRFGEFKMPVVKVGRDDTVEEDVVRLVRQVVDYLEFVGDTDLERAVRVGEEAVVPSAAVSEAFAVLGLFL